MYSQIKEICSCHGEDKVVYSDVMEDVKYKLMNSKIDTVFFDSEIFTETAFLRAVSPATKFVVIARNGFEDTLEKAILFGASDFILCPCFEQEVRDCL